MDSFLGRLFGLLFQMVLYEETCMDLKGAAFRFLRPCSSKLESFKVGEAALLHMKEKQRKFRPLARPPNLRMKPVPKRFGVLKNSRTFRIEASLQMKPAPTLWLWGSDS